MKETDFVAAREKIILLLIQLYRKYTDVICQPDMSKEQHPTLIAIDEPEVNLHPAWQKILAKWIQTNGNFTQCFISTHSPDFLDEFTENFALGKINIFVSDISQDVTFRKVKRERIENEIKEGWQLGDLYRVNDPAIGGWPW